MSDNPRPRRLADRIKTIVATMLDTRIKDPRLGFVTVTDVRVTGDLQHATVFYTVMGTEEEREGTAAALASADRKSTRLNSSHVAISYAVFCLKKKKKEETSIKHLGNYISH